MRCILLLLLLTVSALAAVDIYYAAPGRPMVSPLPASTKLVINNVYLNLDIAAGTFSLNSSVYYTISGGASGYDPIVTVAGNLVFLAPQLIGFSFDNITGCTQIAAPVKLCPFMDELLSGPWQMGFEPNTGATTSITILSSVQRSDPNGGKPINFLGSTVPFPMACLSTPCASIASAFPSTASNPVNETVSCWLSVGNSNPINQACGDITGTRLKLGEDAAQLAGTVFYASGNHSSNTGYVRTDPRFLSGTSSLTSSFRSSFTIGPATLANGAGFSGMRITNTIDPGTTGSNMMLTGVDSRPSLDGGTHAVRSVTAYNAVVTVTAGFNGTWASTLGILSGGASSFILQNTLITIPQVIGYRATGISNGNQPVTLLCGFNSETNGNANTVTTAQYRYTHATTGTNRYGIWSASDVASIASGWVGGTVADVGWFRGRAGAIEYMTGNDIYSTGFACFGTGCTSSAPTAASTGVYDSGIRVVRSFTPGSGISGSISNGVLSLTVPAPEQSEAFIALKKQNQLLEHNLSLLETRFNDLLSRVNVLSAR